MVLLGASEVLSECVGDLRFFVVVPVTDFIFQTDEVMTADPKVSILCSARSSVVL